MKFIYTYWSLCDCEEEHIYFEGESLNSILEALYNKLQLVFKGMPKVKALEKNWYEESRKELKNVSPNGQSLVMGRLFTKHQEDLEKLYEEEFGYTDKAQISLAKYYYELFKDYQDKSLEEFITALTPHFITLDEWCEQKKAHFEKL